MKLFTFSFFFHLCNSVTHLIYGVNTDQEVLCPWNNCREHWPFPNLACFLSCFWDHLELIRLVTLKNQYCLKIQTITFVFSGATFALSRGLGCLKISFSVPAPLCTSLAFKFITLQNEKIVLFPALFIKVNIAKTDVKCGLADYSLSLGFLGWGFIFFLALSVLCPWGAEICLFPAGGKLFCV